MQGSVILSSLHGPSIYADHLMPDRPTGKPTVILIHGGAHSGACYMATIDQRPGWAQRLVADGFPVLVPDWPGTGRSGYVPNGSLTGEIVCAGLGSLLDSLSEPAVVLTHSMSGAFGWRLLQTHGDKIAQPVGVAPAPPGNIHKVPVLAEETDEAVALVNVVPVRLNLREPYLCPLDFVRHKLIGESRYFPEELIPGYFKSLLPIPTRLLYQRWNVRGSALKVDDLSRCRGKRILVITGSDDAGHSREQDGAIVTWLRAAGLDAEFVFLADEGIIGNGHMMMLEQNSDVILDRIVRWLGY